MQLMLKMCFLAHFTGVLLKNKNKHFTLYCQRPYIVVGYSMDIQNLNNVPTQELLNHI